MNYLCSAAVCDGAVSQCVTQSPDAHWSLTWGVWTPVWTGVGPASVSLSPAPASRLAGPRCEETGVRGSCKQSAAQLHCNKLNRNSHYCQVLTFNPTFRK